MNSDTETQHDNLTRRGLSLLQELNQLHATPAAPKVATPIKSYHVYEIDGNKIGIPLELVEDFDTCLSDHTLEEDFDVIINKYNAIIIREKNGN